MKKNTTACRMKSPIAIENMNVEKLRFTKINTISLAISDLNEFKKVHFLKLHVANAAFFI